MPTDWIFFSTYNKKKRANLNLTQKKATWCVYAPSPMKTNRSWRALSDRAKTPSKLNLYLLYIFMNNKNKFICLDEFKFPGSILAFVLFETNQKKNALEIAWNCRLYCLKERLVSQSEWRCVIVQIANKTKIKLKSKQMQIYSITLRLNQHEVTEVKD